MATKRKTSASRKKNAKKKSAPQPQLDRRWSIALFGLGLFFVLLSFIPGESGWSWMRQNILFGVFGISGWLLGPLLIYVAVLIGMEKPVGKIIAKSALVMVALSGTALVFGKLEFSGYSFGEAIGLMFTSARTNHFSGGVMGLPLGYTLLAFCGQLVARILLVVLVIVAVMLFTSTTPADVVHFLQGKWQERPRRIEGEVWEDVEYEEVYDEEPPEPAPSFLFAKRKKKNVDIALDANIVSEPGLATHDDVEIGPGGTFGQDPLDMPERNPAIKEEPILPFDPYSTQSLREGAEQHNGPILLFGEEEMDFAAPEKTEQAAFGGSSSLFEYDVPLTDVPAPTQEAAQAHQEPPMPKLFGFEESEGEAPHGDPDVEALIAKAAAEKVNEKAEMPKPAMQMQRPYQTPPITLFEPAPAEDNSGAKEEMRKTADLLVNTLSSFGVETRILDVSRGPSVTRYEIQPQAGVKISRITNLADDIALNLAAAGVRIEAPIPGKPAVGIEVPNKKKSTVSIRSILENKVFTTSDSPLSIALGKDIAGDCVVTDLSKMPHVLVAGSTGSGKSVCINATIMSFLYKSSPEDVKLLLIDPKVVELAEYNGLPHLLMPVVTEPRKAAGALGAAVAEMERRYHLFAENNVRDIRTYNKLVGKVDGLEKIPYIAIVIDELADLMMVAGKDVETYICRIAQKARAAGMHLIVATQRPSVDVITGLIKANIPSRIAFAVSSQIDSRTILDGAGAEKLLGMGDMLFMPVGANKPVRVQGTYVKDEEISEVISYIKRTSGEITYDEGMIAEMEKRAAAEDSGSAAGGDSNMMSDPVFAEAVDIALEAGQISTSNLQRRLRLGYARAGRLVDEMEQLGIVSGPNGSKPRDVLITRPQWLEMSMNATSDEE